MPENPGPGPFKTKEPLRALWTNVIIIAASHLDDEAKKAEILELLEVE